jgi:hypothetical protein
MYAPVLPEPCQSTAYAEEWTGKERPASIKKVSIDTRSAGVMQGYGHGKVCGAQSDKILIEAGRGSGRQHGAQHVNSSAS